MCHAKGSSEGMPKRQHCLAALVRTCICHPVHHNETIIRVSFRRFNPCRGFKCRLCHALGDDPIWTPR